MVKRVYLYELLDADKNRIYVGITSSPKNRLNLHLKQSDLLPKPYTMHVMQAFSSREEALAVERLVHTFGANGRCSTRDSREKSINKKETKKSLHSSKIRSIIEEHVHARDKRNEQ